jgi:outer membrane protein assembly factor BamB
MMTMNARISMGLGVLGLVALTQNVLAHDWPQWRGPNRDGAVMAFDAPASWPDQQTGDVIWRASYAAPFEMVSATRRHGPGPKSTPTFADGRLFTLGMTGAVTAFDAATGRQLWQVPGQPVQPLYHTAMSPIVDGDVVIVHIGGHNDGALTAFGAATGDVRWSWDGDGPAYGSPMIFDLAGERQVVTFTQEHFVGVSLATGELLWRRPFTTPSTTTSQTPILYKDTVIQAGRANGITAFRVARQGDSWTTEDVWHTDEVSLHMTNGVVIDGVLFGLSHLNSGQYFGLDLDSGEVLWTSEPRQAENAGIVRAGNTIFSLQDDAELLVVRHSRTGFDVVRRYQVADSATWTQPTVSGNRIYVKDVTTLTLFGLD